MAEQQTVTIGEKKYDANSLTERASALLGDISKVDERLNAANLDVSIFNVARSALVSDLLKETENLKEIK